MQFLKTIFWVILAVGIAIFATANWHDVMVDLWGDLRMAIKLPILLALVFGLGFLPTMFYYRARLWRLRRRLELTERNVAQAPVTPRPPAAPQRTPPPQSSSPFEAN
jgi:lipopolysaccharide assembly protein A